MERLMIIPAAGLGSRLKSPIPKVLYPVNGKPMIDYLFDLYAFVVNRFILVLHPSFARQVEEHCAQHALDIEYAIQETPTGMLDAILIPCERMRHRRPESVWVTWCDQIAIHPTTVTSLAKLSARFSQAAMVLPTIARKEPYIHFVRDTRGRIVDVLHRRECDEMPQVGESDMGLFCLTATAYLGFLTEFTHQADRSPITRERNFLPFIPWLQGRAEVLTFPGHDEIESIGINDADDLHRLECFLRRE